MIRISKHGKPFGLRERRMLRLRTERIAPKYLTDGKAPKIEAQAERTERLPTHEARYYQIAGPAKMRAKVQLNHGDPADDEQRLASIAEDLLSPVPNPKSLVPEGGLA